MYRNDKTKDITKDGFEFDLCVQICVELNLLIELYKTGNYGNIAPWLWVNVKVKGRFVYDASITEIYWYVAVSRIEMC